MVPLPRSQPPPPADLAQGSVHTRSTHRRYRHSALQSIQHQARGLWPTAPPPATSAEPCTHLTHAGIPSGKSVDTRTRGSCTRGWWQETLTYSSSWCHRPGHPPSLSDFRIWHQLPLTHTQILPVAYTNLKHQPLQHTRTQDRMKDHAQG